MSGRHSPTHCAHRGMPANGNMKPGQQNVRQEEHHRHLHGLQLVLRQRREGVADRQVGGDEQRGERGQQRQVADDRHAEQSDADAHDQGRLHEADQI